MTSPLLRLSPRAPRVLALGVALSLALVACAQDQPVVEGRPTSLAEPTAPASEPEPPAVGLDRPVFTMWASGGLPEDVPGRAVEVPGIVHAAALRQDTLGLTGSRTADGSVVDDLPEGWRLPVAAAAIEPATWSPFVDDPGARALLERLRPGTVLLAQTFATSRGLTAGAIIDLAGAPGMVVAGVLPNDAVGDAEVVLHASDATAVGILRGPTLVVEHDAPDAAARAQVAVALGALVPDDVAARVVDAQDPTLRRDAPLVLSLAQVKEKFGEFAYRPRSGAREVDADPLWEMANIVRAEVPLLGTVRCHRDILDDLTAALDEIRDVGLGDMIDPDAYAGCWYPRRISIEGSSLSSHSWGISLDINVDLDLPGLGPPPDPEVVAIFGRHGFRWGGDFLTPDNHHFEWVGGIVTSAPPRTDTTAQPTERP